MKIKRIISIFLLLGSAMHTPVSAIPRTSGVNGKKKSSTVFHKGNLTPLVAVPVLYGSFKLGDLTSSGHPLTVPKALSNSTAKINSNRSTFQSGGFSQPIVKTLTQSNTIKYGDMIEKWTKKIGFNDNDSNGIKSLACTPNKLSKILSKCGSSTPPLPWMDGIHFYAVDSLDITSGKVKWDSEGNLTLNEDTVLYDIMPQLFAFILNYLHHLRELAKNNKPVDENYKFKGTTDLDFISFLLDKLVKNGEVSFDIETLQKIFGPKLISSELPIILKFLQMFMAEGFGVEGGLKESLARLASSKLNLGLKIPIIKSYYNNKNQSIQDFLNNNSRGNFVLCTEDSFSSKRRENYVELDLVSKDKFIYNETKLGIAGTLSSKIDANSIGIQGLASSVLNKLLPDDTKKLIYQILKLSKFALESLRKIKQDLNFYDVNDALKALKDSIGVVTKEGENNIADADNVIKEVQELLNKVKEYIGNEKIC